MDKKKVLSLTAEMKIHIYNQKIRMTKGQFIVKSSLVSNEG
jgi:hypothetical protein